MKCDALLQNVKKLSRYFNSRTHVECDEIVCSSWFDREISTHALTWSATALIRKQQLSHFISTHALTWSATMRGMLSEPSMVISTHALTWSATMTMCLQSDWFLFQLTHSRGVRQLQFGIFAMRMGISTHALTWSATINHLPPRPKKKPFQLTHSRGVRL